MEYVNNQYAVLITAIMHKDRFYDLLEYPEDIFTNECYKIFKAGCYMNIQEWLEAGKPWNVILHGDCMDLMKHFHNKEIQLCITDPPYGIGDFRVGCGIALTGEEKYKKIEWNEKTPTELYFNELYRISKNQIIFGFQYYMPYIQSKGIIIHNKKIPFEMNLSMADIASCSLQNRVTVFEYRWQGMLQEDMKNKQKRVHPCEKPIALYRWILQNYAKPNDKIIDTHFGSGSLACACHLEKFDFLAIEKDEDYYKSSVERLNTLEVGGFILNGIR